MHAALLQGVAVQAVFLPFVPTLLSHFPPSSGDKQDTSKAIREGGDDAFDATVFLQQTGKGKQVSAIVEGVMNGSMLRVTLLPSLQSASIQVCGVQAPSMGRRAAADAEAPAAAAAAGGAPPSAAAIAAMPAQAGSANAEPFAREAKHVTEMRALNREVTLVVEGVDKYNNLFASVLLPPAPGADAAAPKESLAELLLKMGFAKVSGSGRDTGERGWGVYVPKQAGSSYLIPEPPLPPHPPPMNPPPTFLFRL